ncbi:hypothetical protein DL96DRAFT_772228 [Flagelloscypha sp. PMI_526]|nr:hypothetical protein DL96DRAFT_772228 [Flagelloscypha sp. PMI_526]
MAKTSSSLSPFSGVQALGDQEVILDPHLLLFFSLFSMASQADELALLFSSLHLTQVVGASSLATVAFLVYETLLCLRMEVEHIWSARWSVVKVLYLFARYYGLAAAGGFAWVSMTIGPIGDDVCRGFLWWFCLSFIIFVLSVDIVLSIRVMALYDNSLIIGGILFFLMASYTGLGIFGVSRSLMAATPIPFPQEVPLQGCIWQQVSLPYIGWIPNLLMSTTLFVMMIVRIILSPVNVLTYKESGFREAVKQAFKQTGGVSPLMTTFVRDGTIFFFLTLVTTITYLLVLQLSQTVGAPIFQSWFIGIYSFSATRLILNLKEQGSRRNEYETSVTDVGPLEFKPKSMRNISVDTTSQWSTVSSERTYC